MLPDIRDFYQKKGMPASYSKIGEQYDEFILRDRMARSMALPFRTPEARRNERPDDPDEDLVNMDYYSQCDDRYPNSNFRDDESTMRYKRHGE